MGKRFAYVLILCAALLLCMGMAAAEEETQFFEMELISQGGLPEPPMFAYYGFDELEDYVVSEIKEKANAGQITVSKVQTVNGKEISFGPAIDISSYGIAYEQEAFKSFLQSLVNNHPELFYVNGYGSVKMSSDGIIIELYLGYEYFGQDLVSRISAFESKVNEIARYASSASTDIGKMLMVNDYLCVNYEYDNSLSIYRPDLFFTEGTGVCQAYMMAYANVLNKLGIANTYATSSSMNHIWNMVQLGNDWYHIDVTWNDPTKPDIPLYAGHSNFLRSDTGIGETGHYGWVSSVTADSAAYDSAAWVNLDSPLPVNGNYVYYYDEEPDSNAVYRIYRWNSSTGENTQIHSFCLRDSGDSVSLYGEMLALANLGDRVYYGSLDELYCYDISENSRSLIYTAENDAQIWSAWRSGNKLKLLVGSNPPSGSIVQIELEGWKLEMSVTPALSEMEIGGTVQMSAKAVDAPDTELEVTWTSSNENVATVDQSGLVTAVGVGAAEITAVYDSNSSASALVVIHSETITTLPEDLTTIDEEAFKGIAAEEIVIPSSVTAIGNNAFEGCAALKLITIPASVTEIGETIFKDCPNVSVICEADSKAQAYAGAIPVLAVVMELE